MTFPTSPFVSEGAVEQFHVIVQSLHQSDTLANWAPPIAFSVTPSCSRAGDIVPELVVAVGTATNNKRFFYFESLYDEFIVRGGEDVAVLKCFIKALTFRRCRSMELLASVLSKIFRNPLLDAEDWEDLASIVADLNSKSIALELMERSKMGTRKQRPCFYSHLMRFAAEQLSIPCFKLVMSIVDAINATGATWTEATMYHLLGAFCRIKNNMPYETILHIVTEWRDARLREDAERQPTPSSSSRRASKSPTTSAAVKGEHVPDSPFPTSILSRLLSLCERALGADVVHAKAIMDLLGNRQSWDRCISVVEASYEFERPPLHEPWSFYLIDPLTIDVKLLGEPRPSSHYVFMFSALRALCERAQMHGEGHYIHSAKLQPIRTLFRTYPTRIVVLPPEIELALRVGGIDECEPSPTPSYFSHICPRCVSSTVPAHSYCVGMEVHNQVHDCGLPSVLPSNGGVSLLTYFVKCSMNLHCQPGRSLLVVTTNNQVIKELMPLTLRFSSSWFSICDQIVVHGGR
ncbi:GPI-anchored surface protein, putative [Bodo saltans]|uniref:GPI-anchored surface protein, putative n=1 Tax=Bodo saltans TaxID=75058 RepID=A0A0S4J7J7_BODSA|nr:GPI-anchored surface protein, putative [Bodo saltans]|eukprot:CUG86035.1 GPI-anchored surface protein, putative [Bodo saltans]